MVLGRKTNCLLGKDGFEQENQLFPRKKLVLGRKTNFLFGKKMVLGRKTNFFLGKRWSWAGKPTSSQEKDGFVQETHLFLGKTKKPSFWSLAVEFPKRCFCFVFLFSRTKKVGFPYQNHLFPRK